MLQSAHSFLLFAVHLVRRLALSQPVRPTLNLYTNAAYVRSAPYTTHPQLQTTDWSYKQ